MILLLLQELLAGMDDRLLTRAAAVFATAASRCRLVPLSRSSVGGLFTPHDPKCGSGDPVREHMERRL